jgi:predicted RNase H-like HicB family nuclease
MTTEPSKVTATAGPSPDSVRVSHNDFPNLRADGDSVEDAAANLVQVLTRALNDTEDDAHRASLRQAITEVQAFIERPTAG